MTPAEWASIREILEGALETPAEKREHFLADKCAGDERLLKEVRRYLEYENAADRAFAAPLSLTTASFEPDMRIGAYRLVREIGHGGMGVVWLAERDDGEFTQRAAIKLIPAGFNHEQVLTRFRAERQILAMLDHPYIAHLLDGGALQDSRPYLVMEYVEGEHLIEYCEKRALSIEERLDLFLKVCDAVACAHRNLVIHRDLKPANILVTSEGVPKLLDFGIGKILAESSAGPNTAVEFRAFTASYASPEQIQGLALSTATDVYSLGVVLYELLSGTRPFDLDTLPRPEQERVVCENDPEAPSRKASNEPLARCLRGDLDSVTLKALRKDPESRYRSADEFADDIRRYLAHAPVRARRPTILYRTRKFARRHRVGVAAAAVASVSLALGAATTIWQARKAERSFNRARQIAHSMVFEIHDAIRDLPGSLAARKLVVERGLEYFDALSQESGRDPSLDWELADGYMRFGDVQGGKGDAHLGDSKGAERSYSRALALYEQLLKRKPNDLRLQRGHASAEDSLGSVLLGEGESVKAEALLRRALTEDEKIAATSHGSASANLDLIRGLNALASVQTNRQDFQSLLDTRRRILALSQTQAAIRPQDEDTQHDLALAYKTLGAVLGKLERYEEGTAAYEAALAIDERRAAAQPEALKIRLDVSYDTSDLGWILIRLNRLAEAEANYRKTVALRTEVAAGDANDYRAHWALFSAQYRLAGVLSDEKKFADAIAAREAAIQNGQRLTALNSRDKELRNDLAESYAGLAIDQLADGKRQAALASLARAKSTAATLAQDGKLDPSSEARVKTAMVALQP